MVRVYRILCFLAAVLGLALATPLDIGIAARPSDNVLVSAAASLTDSLTAVAGDYERTAGIHVLLNFGPSSGLARQIIAGAPADLFVSADEAQMETLANAGLVDQGTRVDLLSNQLVIVRRPDGPGVSSPTDLRAASVRHIALADPAGVPAGVYAKQYLEKLGLWSAVEPKVVPTVDVRAALAAVDSGNADAAFVYRTDAAIAHRAVIAFRVPVAQGPRIVYPAAVVKNAPHEASARAFLTFLKGPAARAAFERAGFIVIGQSAP